jgi:eukaryotic-like serine/threonine-protein kinase
MKPVSGNGAEELIVGSSAAKLVCDWSLQGEHLLFRSPDSSTKFDLWAVPTQGERKPFPVLNSRFNEPAGSFSPDGRWLAFQSDETGGRYEVYVQPFPNAGERVRISTDGGGLPRWQRNGKELFYVGLDGSVFSVGVEESAGRLTPSTPRVLFKTRMTVNPTDTLSCQKFDVTSDGQRFVASIPPDPPPNEPAIVILNWNRKPFSDARN